MTLSEYELRNAVRARHGLPPVCSMCRENPSTVRVHVDGSDIYWCGDCIADRINTTRGILKTSTGVSDSRKDDAR